MSVVNMIASYPACNYATNQNDSINSHWHPQTTSQCEQDSHQYGHGDPA